MIGNDMMEVEGMDTVVDHYHPMNHRPEVVGIYMMEEHYHPMNHRPKVEGMNREDSCMEEDMTVEMEVVGREPEGVVLVRHWIGDETVRHRRTCREWKKLAKSGCSKGQPTFVSRDSNCCSP
jgi:hypothetical protein